MPVRKSPRTATKKRAPASPGDAVGLDLGTSSVVAARQNGRGIHAEAELNAFIELPTSRFTEQILHQNEIDFVRENGHLVVFGNGAFRFANMFNTETRRPMRHGLVNASEPYAQKLLEVIVDKLVGKSASAHGVRCLACCRTFRQFTRWSGRRAGWSARAVAARDPDNR